MIKKMKLGEVVEFQRGYDLTHSNMKDGEYPVIGSTSIIGYHNQYKACDGIVIGRSGSVGKPKLIKGQYWPHNTTLFTTDIKGNNLEYLYYSLCNFDIDKMKSGSNIPTLNRNDLYPLQLLFETDVDEQEKVASVLKTIDDKIENNNKINTELESMAKTIYDYWFLQFDFPDENGKPYKSSGGKMVWNEELKKEIPKEWKIQKLSEVCTLHNGINYDKSESGDKTYNIINVRNITASSLLLNTADLDKIELKSTQAEKYIVGSDDILIARSGTPGAIRLLLSDTDDIIYCGFIIKCSPNNNKHTLLLTYSLKRLEGSNVTKTGGSIMQNVSQDTLKQINICLPTDDIIDKFNKTMEPLLKKIQQGIQENNELISLRDFLLPLLMNGQVRFKEKY